MYWPLRNRLLLLLILSAGQLLFAQDQKVVVVPTNTEITFSVKHLGVLTVEGSFKEFDGFLEFDNGSLRNVQCEVLVSSIDTDDDSRDDTLRSEAYFDVQRFPVISFDQTGVNSNEKEGTIIGLLQLKGVQKEVEIKYSFEANKVDGRVLNLSSEISREYFELEFGSMNALIGDTVKIQIRVNL